MNSQGGTHNTVKDTKRSGRIQQLYAQLQKLRELEQRMAVLEMDRAQEHLDGIHKMLVEADRETEQHLAVVGDTVAWQRYQLFLGRAVEQQSTVVDVCAKQLNDARDLTKEAYIQAETWGRQCSLMEEAERRLQQGIDLRSGDELAVTRSLWNRPDLDSR